MSVVLTNNVFGNETRILVFRGRVIAPQQLLFYRMIETHDLRCIITTIRIVLLWDDLSDYSMRVTSRIGERQTPIA
jgi:hypothetical protein